MSKTAIEKTDKASNQLRAKLITIEALVFLLPGLAIAYVYYQKHIDFDIIQVLIFLAILVLILGGMMILRQFFDRILMIQTLMKKAEAGDQHFLDIKKGTSELHEITTSFNNLLVNFQEANRELQRRIEEIAKRKQIEAILRQAKEEAEAANVSKSRFIANMSHEFLTPLNAVIGFSEILKTKTHGELNEKQLRYVENVLESGQHLLKLVNSILELSKIEANNVEMKLSDFDTIVELHETVNLIQASADKKGIALSLDVQPDIPTITADQEKFRQIILNLLNNAVKFTPDGGKIKLEAKLIPDYGLWISDLVEKGKISADKLTMNNHQPSIEIRVADTGIGVKPENQKRIFSLFEQVDASTQRLFGGTGLGLAMSRKFVELHKGKMWVESEGIGKGCTFFVVLPCGTKQ